MTTFYTPTINRANQDYRYATPTTAFSNKGLTRNEMYEVAPAIFAEGAYLGDETHKGVSKWYAFMSTIGMLQPVLDLGAIIIYVAQAHTADEARNNYVRHMVRVRFPDHNLADSRRAVEAVFYTAHDGSNALRGAIGHIEYACWNQCVSGSDLERFSLTHRGDPKVIVSEVQTLLKRAPLYLGRMESYEAIHLTRQEQIIYAEEAMFLRYPAPPTIVDGVLIVDAEPTTDHFPFRPERLLSTRIQEHQNDSLQSSYQRAQGALSQHGGVQGHDGSGRRRKSQSIKDITKKNALDAGLDRLAAKMAAIKNAQ